MKTALLCIDFINDVIAEGGKLAGKGYASFAGRHKTYDHLRNLKHALEVKECPLYTSVSDLMSGTLAFRRPLLSSEERRRRTRWRWALGEGVRSRRRPGRP